MAIVTMSHEIGAGGPEIGQQLAERLGCRYVDHELISNAATRYGLLEEKLYDLVINTEKLSTEAAVGLLAGVVGQPELATTPASAQLVSDRSLASRVQVALATHPETRKYRITVEARSGVVTLEGTAAMDEAMDVARSVEGVRAVNARQVDIPPIPPFEAEPAPTARSVGPPPA